MQITDLTFEIRDASFNKVAMLQPGDGLTTLKATLRFNNVGSWEIAIPAGTNADLLRTPGYGLVCTGPNGVLFSGPTVAATAVKDSENPKGVWSIRGATDAIVLGEHLAYPTPTTADVTAQSNAYDARSGVASTVMYGYVQRNLVSGTAPAARAVAGLSIATDTAIGSTVVYNARFQKLGDLLSTLAAVSNPQLGFDIKQVGTGIVFSVYQPADKSGLVRMDAANGTLQKVQYGYGYGATRAIVGGMGQLTARQFVEVSNSSAESQWARRVEVFVDQNNESDTTKLTQYGKDKLAEGGSITSIEVTPSSDLVMEYGVDWNLGDTVSVIIDSQQVSAIVSQATLTVSEDGVRVGATVGQPSGFDFDSILMKRQVDQASDISTLQLKETGGTATLVPAGGASGAVLAKSSASDYATAWTLVADANVASGAAIAKTKISGTAITAADTNTVTGAMIAPNVSLSNPLLSRIDSASEGGQINFARASDGSQTWYIDSYGSTSTPSLRFVDGTSERLSINGSGAVSFNGQAGTSGQTLTSGGASAPPTWTTLPTSAVLQVVSATRNSIFSTTSASFVDVTGVSVSITPKSATSKILVRVTGMVSMGSSTIASIVGLVRNTTLIGQNSGSNGSHWYYSTVNGNSGRLAIEYLDSPATTSATTYKLQLATSAAGSSVAVGGYLANTGAGVGTITTITVMEIA